MKILIVSEVFRPGIGGVQSAIDALTSGLVSRGDSVTVMTGSPKGIVRSYREDDGDVTVVRLPALPSPFNPKNNRFSVLYGRAIRHYFKTEKPDVIHFMTPYSPLYKLVARCARNEGIPYVVTNHTMPANFEMNTRFSAIFRPFVSKYFKESTDFMNTSSMVTAPTQAALSATPGVTAPVQAISNGVDTDFYCPGPIDDAILEKFSISTEKRIITFTGRLDGEKRIDILIDAMQQISSQHNNIQLVIVGKGLLDESLQARARSLGDACVFTGFVSEDEKRAILQASSVFVMPSPAELQCIAALEALACGVPIVVADQVALPELLDGGRNGFAFPYPSVEACADTLLAVLNSKQYGEITKNARHWTVENHSIDGVIRQYRALYGQVVATH